MISIVTSLTFISLMATSLLIWNHTKNLFNKVLKDLRLVSNQLYQVLIRNLHVNRKKSFIITVGSEWIKTCFRKSKMKRVTRLSDWAWPNLNVVVLGYQQAYVTLWIILITVRFSSMASATSVRRVLYHYAYMNVSKTFRNKSS